MFVIRRSVAFLGVLCLVVGCGGGGISAPKTVDVKGKVTLDGAPMPTGEVALEGSDGFPPAIMDVTNGAFKGKASAGRKTVRISSYKTVAQKATGPGAEAEGRQNVIPAKYNSESTETVEVTAGGPNEFEFKVTSK
jgi:hypothetical protein